MTHRQSGKTRQRTARGARRGGARSARSANQYWRIAGGVAGLAVSALVLLTMFGGRRGIAERARELLDWESQAPATPGSDSGERANRPAPAAH